MLFHVSVLIVANRCASGWTKLTRNEALEDNVPNAEIAKGSSCDAYAAIPCDQLATKSVWEFESCKLSFDKKSEGEKIIPTSVTMNHLKLRERTHAAFEVGLIFTVIILLVSTKATRAGGAEITPPGFADLSVLRLGTPAILENGLARSLIYESQKLDPEPVGTGLKAFKLENERGIELISLYRKAAPAVVFILLEEGHASGFVINKDGWLVTNHHVAEHGTLQEDLSREVLVMFGRFNDHGTMEPLGVKYRAVLHKWDKVRDLALLKLKDKPAWTTQSEMPVIKIGEKDVNAGDDVMAVGHASVTLLWSMKPGVVQGVGRRLSDLAGDFATREMRSEETWKNVTKAHDSELESEIERELKPMRDVMVVQATCPILEGDSGGPLLNLADGRAVGITSYFNAKSLGGAAHFFIHASEIRKFVKDAPENPERNLSSFWETEANQASIADLDKNGQPDTLILSRISRSATGFLTNIVGFGWDLAEQSDIRPFIKTSPAGSSVDVEGVCRAKAMRLQVYMVRDNSATICAYDLDNDGHFELVRVGSGGSGQCSSELYSAGPNKPYQTRRLIGKEPVLLPPARIPEAWRSRYLSSVLGLFKAKKAPPHA
jgi:S1-C subfamily serine protease